MYFLKLLVVICGLIVLCESSSFTIYKNELSDDAASTIAMGIAAEELQLKHNESALTDRLSKAFQTLYGGEWLSIVGPSATIEIIIAHITAAPNTKLWFSYNATNILLYKSLQIHEPTYNEVMTQASRFNTTFQYSSFNSSMEASLLEIIKEAIKSSANMSCTSKTFSRNLDNCYNYLSARISSKLQSNYGYSWVVITDLYDKGSWSYELLDSVWDYYGIVFDNLLDITLMYLHRCQK